jgi:hypothetical protein
MSTISYTMFMPKVARLDAAPFGFIMGEANLTSYSFVPDTALLGYFKPGTGLLVALAGVSSGGYMMTWVGPPNNCWLPYDMATGVTVAPGTNAGTFLFLAMGQMG